MVKSAKRAKLAHAYLFYGPPQVGKATLALEFAAWLLCENSKSGLKHINRSCGHCRSCLDIKKNQHPDVFILRPRQEEKKGVVKTYEIGIGEIKELLHQLSLSAYAAPYKIAIIDGAEWLTPEAANGFLKTLEEPSARSLIILISSAWQSLLPTMVSRCQAIKFNSASENEIEAGAAALHFKNDKELRSIIKMAAGRPGRAIQVLENPRLLAEQKEHVEIFKKILGADLVYRFDLAQKLSQDTAVAQEIISQWVFWLRQRLLQSSGADELVFEAQEWNEKKTGFSNSRLLDLIREAQKTQQLLGNASINARLALETLMIKI